MPVGVSLCGSDSRLSALPPLRCPLASRRWAFPPGNARWRSGNTHLRLASRHLRPPIPIGGSPIPIAARKCPIAGSPIPIAGRKCSSASRLSTLATRLSPLADGNADRSLSNGHRRRSKSHWRAKMLFGTAAISIGETPISIAAAPIPISGRRWRSARRKCVLPAGQWTSATLRNAFSPGNGLCRDGNAFWEAGNLGGDRSDGHPEGADEDFRDGNLLRQGSDGRGRHETLAHEFEKGRPPSPIGEVPGTGGEGTLPPVTLESLPRRAAQAA
jgi:hypothetical protein